MSEKFCLKWNDFHSNVSRSFGIFRNENYLHDVTLVSNDQQQVTAHKFVLSASSDFFKNIFKNNKHSNPFLCLDGVSSTDLNNILDYIYNGEVQIYQDQLDRFLDIAQRFRIEGLLGTDSDTSEKQENKEEKKFTPTLVPPIGVKNPENPIPEKFEVVTDNSSIQLNNQILSLDTSDINEIDERLYENMEKNIDGIYSCKICGKTNTHKTKMKLHIETHMEGVSFPCNICGKEFRSRNSLQSHIYKKICKLPRVDLSV